MTSRDDVHQPGDATDAELRRRFAALPGQDFIDPLPDKQRAIAAACAAGPRRGVGRAVGMQRWAAAAALVLLLATGAWQVLWSPGGADRWSGTAGSTGRGDLLAPQTAWAAVSGQVIEFEQIALGRDNPQRGNGPSRSKQFEAAVDAFTARHAGLLPPDGDWPLASVREAASADFGWWRRNWYKIVLLSDDPALRDELLADLSQLPALWGPVFYSADFYYNEKYPELLCPGAKLIVDGRSYAVPQDIPEHYMRELLEDFELSPEDVLYRAFWLPGEPIYSQAFANWFQVGEICKVEKNVAGDLVVTTLYDTAPFEATDNMFDISSTEPRMYMRPASLLKHRDEMPADYDPVPELQQLLSARGLAAGTPPPLEPADPLYTYYFMVLDEATWTGEMDDLCDADHRASTFAIYEQAKDLTSQFIAGHPNLTPLRPDRPVIVQPLVLGRRSAPGQTELAAVVLLRCLICTTDPATAEAYRQAILDGTGLTVSYTETHPPATPGK
jgi:hypothetical protein